MIRVLIDLLGSFYSNGDLAHVESIAHSILAAIPDDHVSLQFLGLVYYRTGRISEAIGVFNKVVSRNGRASELKVKLGKNYLSRKDYAAAAVCYEEATRLDPNFAQAWHDLGVALAELGRPAHAIAAFRSALIACPEFPEAMQALGRVGLLAGDLAAAEEGFSGLSRLQPHSVDALLGLARVHRRRRDFTAASICYRLAQSKLTT